MAAAIDETPPATDQHRDAHRGAVAARLWALRLAVAAAADHIDADPLDAAGVTRTVAFALRHLVESGSEEVIGRVGRALGAGPLCRDSAHAHRVADLSVYLRQHHGERDLAELGTDPGRTALRRATFGLSAKGVVSRGAQGVDGTVERPPTSRDDI